MTHLIRLASFAFFTAVLLLTVPLAAQGQSGGARLEQFLEQAPPAELVPGAERYGPVAPAPTPVAAAYRGEEIVGYVFLTSQFVNTAGYSAKPIHIVVGLDTSGTIVGMKLVAHSEPIVLIGIDEQRVIDYLAPFVGYNPLQAAAEGRGLPRTDIVSGATVTVLVMGESVVRAAVRVARALELGAAAQPAAAAPAARIVDPEAGAISDWDSLVTEGAVSMMHLSIGEVNQAFEASGNEAAAARPQSGDPEDTFIELYTALVSQPAIGRSLLGDSEYETMRQMLAPGQQAVLIAGDGVYSFKGSGYVRGGIFDRIEVLQGTETIRFRDLGHRRVGWLSAEGAPRLREIGVFLVPENAEFDPTQPWRLQLLVQRSIGALDKAFEAFELPYQLPERYTKLAPGADAASAAGGAPGAAPGSAGLAPSGAGAGAGAGAAQESADAGTGTATGTAGTVGAPGITPGAAPGGMQGPTAGAPAVGAGTETGTETGRALPGSLEELEQVPLWQRIWESKVAAIVMLGVMLGVLTLIFFFQDPIVAREKLYDRIRLIFLATTLIWLGWVAQAQLSVVNVLTFTTALRTGFDWSAFLIDPLVFILWCSVAAALLFWGRGPFCGWLCPFGALQELTNRIAKAVKVPQIKVPWGIHERAITLKYIIFLGLFGVSLGSLALAEVMSEVEPFKTAIILRFMREWWFVAFAVALLVAGLFIERFFCRYLCPLGAALAIPGRLRIFDWLKRYRECGNPCMRCFNECPVEAIYPEGPINPNECIGCLHCQQLYHNDRKCPVVIQRRVKREKREAIRQPVAQPVAMPMSTKVASRGAES